MSNLARKLEFEVFQAIGQIIRKTDGVFMVRTHRGDLTCKRAVGCLVEPREEDRVLVAGEARDVCYVLSVLERAGTGVLLECEGDLDIRLKNGRFRVASQEGIDLVSPKEVAIATGEVRVHAATGNVVLDELAYFGTMLRSEIGKMKIAGGTLDSVLERVSQRVKRSFRTVTELDQVKAERIDYAAKQSLTMRGENAIVTAEQLVKFDGEQIHMG